MRRIALAVVCILALSLFAIAGGPRGGTGKPASGSGCTNDNALPSTGIPVGDFINTSTTGYYFATVISGHSYSIEVEDATDPWDGTSLSLGIVQNDCTTVIPSTDIALVDPSLQFTSGDRISWIATIADTNISVTNSDSLSGYSYHISLTDTTLHNPRWSTFNGYVTQYGFLNNTTSSISGVLTVTESNNTVHTLNVTIPASTMVLRTISPSGDVIVPANRFGSASFAFVGPPGAITADAYFVGPNASVVVPAVFAPRNFQH